MDVLSQILDSVEMRGSLYFTTEFGEPWGLDVPADSNVCRFHVVTRGRCHLTVLPAGEALVLSPGDLALVPHGSAHRLQSAQEAENVDLASALHSAGYTGEGPFRYGGDGDVTRMVCGYFDFDKEAVDPLLASLPRVIHVEATGQYDFGWLDSVIRFIGQEAGGARPGSGAVSRRLSEILFIQVIRSSGPKAIPVLSGLEDDHIGPALRAIHSAFDEAWSLEALSRVAGLSRTTFAQRFAERLGMPAMQYVTRVRMERGRRLLRTELAVAAIAGQVGYQSEAAFHRRFKETFGVGPGRYRRRLRGRSSPTTGPVATDF